MFDKKWLLFLALAAAPAAAQPADDLDPDTWDMPSVKQAAESIDGPGALSKEEASAATPAPSSFTPSTGWKEEIQEWEAAFFAELASMINEMQKIHADRADGKLRRAFHAKSHAGVTAKFKINDNLPEFARQGIFKTPKSYDCWVRFSNGVGNVQSDRSADVRGLAVKVFGAEGPRALPGENARTQDFLATNRPSSGTFPSPREFITFSQLTMGNRLLFAGRLIRALGFRGALRAFKFVFSLTRTVRSLATEAYFSGAAIKFGPYAMKFQFRPSTSVAGAAPKRGEQNHLQKDLAKRLKTETVKFDFVGQFFVNEKVTPIEEGRLVEWTEKNSPVIKLGELIVEPRDLDGADAKQVFDFVETLSFNPWHAIEDHRPLGNVMRARKIAYEASPRFRSAAEEPATFSPAPAPAGKAD